MFGPMSDTVPVIFTLVAEMRSIRLELQSCLSSPIQIFLANPAVDFSLSKVLDHFLIFEHAT